MNYLIDMGKNNTSEYMIIKEFNSTTSSYILQYIPKNIINQKDNYLSVIGELYEKSIGIEINTFTLHYNPVKIEDFLNDDSSALAIALGITIPIVVIALAIVGYIFYKRRKNANKEILNENKTEELMPIQNS